MRRRGEPARQSWEKGNDEWGDLYRNALEANAESCGPEAA